MLYICRQDGLVWYLELDDNDDPLVRTTSHAGSLRGYIGTAFASLDIGVNTNDLLIAGGESSSGGLYMVSLHPFAYEISQQLSIAIDPT